MGSTNNKDIEVTPSLQGGAEVLSDAEMMTIFYEKLNKVNALEKELHKALKAFALLRHPSATSCFISGDVIQQSEFEIKLECLQSPAKWFHLPFWRP